MEAFVVGAARTPVGRFLGGLSTVPAPRLGAVAIRAALDRAPVTPDSVDEVVMGNVLGAGVGQAPARQAALAAGLPAGVAAFGVNKVCGSGLKAVMLAAAAVRLGEARAVVAGGMESMSLAPHLLRDLRTGRKMGEAALEDAMLVDGLWCSFGDSHMGAYAEYTASQHGVSREDQDRFAVESQHRAARAAESGAFDAEIVPVTVAGRRIEVEVSRDEGPRPDSTLDGLAGLKPVFDSEGTVTAGNSSQLSDGAAAVVVADEETANRCSAPWKARIVASHTSGTEPRDLFVAPVTAIRGALEKAELRTHDVGLYEINEAFAAQMLACLRQLDLDPEKVNVHGGAIALGHPIGASGARVLVTLLSAMHQRNEQYGVAALCLGGGNAVAMVVERTP